MPEESTAPGKGRRRQDVDDSAEDDEAANNRGSSRNDEQEIRGASHFTRLEHQAGRDAAAPPSSSGDASPAATLTPNALPTYKDQVRDRKRGNTNQAPAPTDRAPSQKAGRAATADAAATDAGLPSFKDQAREHRLRRQRRKRTRQWWRSGGGHQRGRQQQQQQPGAQAVGPPTPTLAQGDDSSSSSEEPSRSTLLVEAHARGSLHSFGRCPWDHCEPPACDCSCRGCTVDHRCHCRGHLWNGELHTGRNYLRESPTVTPTTLAPTSAPTLDPRPAKILGYISNITFSAETIRYPVPPNESATPEEKAVEWLIRHDPLQLTSETEAEQFRLKQRYALATFAFAMSWETWDSAGGWFTERHESSWYGINGDDDFEDYVTSIAMAYNNLTSIGGFSGGIPADIALLSNITKIHCRSNPKLWGHCHHPLEVGNV